MISEAHLCFICDEPADRIFYLFEERGRLPWTVRPGVRERPARSISSINLERIVSFDIMKL